MSEVSKNSNTGLIVGLIISTSLAFIFALSTLLLLFLRVNSDNLDGNNNYRLIKVPVAVHSINPTTQLISNDITYITMPNNLIGDNVILDVNEIIGRYTNLNATIPKGSMFYEDLIVGSEKIPGNWIEQLDNASGELGYYMPVDLESTLGNSILPNTYIDIYLRAKNENGLIMFGKLLENVKVLVVHDANGNNVFQSSDQIGVPARIGFAVNQDVYILLKKAEYLNLEFVLLPKGQTMPSSDYVVVTSETLRDYIDSLTIAVD